jgi:uncharacterized membrane protein
MLLLFVPLYAAGAGVTALLVIQAVAVTAGALPAYRLGRFASHSEFGGFAVAATYLLSPLGQWAVLSDFHTSALAAPLLVLTVERLIVGARPRQALAVAVFAASAREDVGPAIAVLGIAILLGRFHYRRYGVAFLVFGLGWTLASVLVIRAYSGGIMPFEVRYGATVGSGLMASLHSLGRPVVVEYAKSLLLSGGWLGLFAPLALLPTLPSLALNVLSTSPWMAAGKAHYSGLVLPFLIVGAAAGLGTVTRRAPRLRSVASVALIATSTVGYVSEGAGPLGGNYAPGYLTDHATIAQTVASSLPSDAAISATSSLVPLVSRRPRVYVFPALNDAEYVFLDLKASPAPTSAGDVYLRVQDLIANHAWGVETNQDGILVLRRGATNKIQPAVDRQAPAAGFVEPVLIDAALVPSPDGAIDVDGPHWVLRTTWWPSQPIPAGTRLAFNIQLRTGERIQLWDVADLWWNPPEAWTPSEAVTIDVPDIPVREFDSWQASWTN